jgi:hypothetical protein
MVPVGMAIQEPFVTFLISSGRQHQSLECVCFASMLLALSISAVYLWRRDLLAIDETRYSAPTYKVIYLGQYLFMSLSLKATRPEGSTHGLNAVAVAIVTILMKYIFSVLSPLLVVYDPCVPSVVILLCSNELRS